MWTRMSKSEQPLVLVVLTFYPVLKQQGLYCLLPHTPGQMPSSFWSSLVSAAHLTMELNAWCHTQLYTGSGDSNSGTIRTVSIAPTESAPQPNLSSLITFYTVLIATLITY